MNYIERLIDRKLRRFAWKSMRLESGFSGIGVEGQINQYRWIIRNKEEGLLYDTERDGYEGLNAFPVVFEALDVIEKAEKTKMKRKRRVEKRKVIFTFDSQLVSIFPNEELEKMCIPSLSVVSN